MMITGLCAYSGMSLKPMNYAIKNNSEVSDVYVKSIEKTGGTNQIDSANPVIYPNASVSSADAKGNSAKSLEASKSFNDIAESFGGINTSYGVAGEARTYSTVGSNFDTYA